MAAPDSGSAPKRFDPAVPLRKPHSISSHSAPSSGTKPISVH